MAGKPIFSGLSIIVQAGALLLLIFILLAGVKNSTPLDQFFWFEFDTSGISSNSVSNIPNPVRWTPYNYCGVSENGRNINCSPKKAAFPFKPQTAFETTQGIPSDLIENESTYFYLSRISYGFYIVAAGFTLFALSLAFLGCCSRLASAASAFLSFLALLFAAAASGMITAVYVMAKNAFSDIGVHSSIGVKMMAFTWTVVACLLIAFFLLCCSCAVGRRHDHDASSSAGGFFARKNKASSASSQQHVLHPESSFERTYESEKPPSSGRGFFHVNRRQDDPAPNTYYSEPEPTPLIIAK